MSTIYDVAVVGAGPSGATAAFHLAKNGLKVALIEKEILPRYKTCGGGFVFRGRNMLPFDIQDIIEAEFNTVEILFPKADIHLQAKRDFPVISMVMRDTFDFRLCQEAEKLGVEILADHKLLSIEKGENWILKTSQNEIHCKAIIAADGALSQTAKMTFWKDDTRHLIPAMEYEVEVNNADWERLKTQVRFDVDIIPHGYAWSFPKKNHLSIGVASVKRMKVDLRTFYVDYLKTLGINEVVSEKSHGFQIPMSRRTDGFSKDNVLLIGDAAGFADPITAEGISNAIYSGKLAAEALVEGQLNPQKVDEIYLTKLNAKLLPELKTADFLADLFYKQTRIRNLLMKQYGDHFVNYMTDIFAGDRTYPADIKKSMVQKIKSVMFRKKN